MADVPLQALVALVGDDQFGRSGRGALGGRVGQLGFTILPFSSAADPALSSQRVHHAVLWREELITRCTVDREIRWAFAIWPRLLPCSRSRRIARRSKTSG